MVGRDLSPRLPRRYNLDATKISASGMRFPSGIAAGPVPAEPSAAPSRRRILTILQIDSNVFKAILRDTPGSMCVHILYCHRTIIAPLACAATIDLVVSVSH